MLNKYMTGCTQLERAFPVSYPAVTRLSWGSSSQLCLPFPSSSLSHLGCSHRAGLSSSPISLIKRELFNEDLRVYSCGVVSFYLAFLKNVAMLRHLSGATEMPSTETAHVRSGAVAVSTVLDSDSTAQDSRPSGSLDHRTH